MALLSIVLPAYNEEENILEAVTVLGGLLEEEQVHGDGRHVTDGGLYRRGGGTASC